MNSPCLTCTRVKNPQSCENKACNDWQCWFLDRWESMRRYVRDQIRKDPLQDAGIPLGGHKYPAPDQIREYLHIDPCTQCQIPADLCSAPCRRKEVWQGAREEVAL